MASLKSVFFSPIVIVNQQAGIKQYFTITNLTLEDLGLRGGVKCTYYKEILKQ